MHDETQRMNPDPTLAKLLEGWLDDGLSETEQSDLLRQLREDPDLRRHFAEHVAMIGATRAAADAHPRWLALFDLLDHPEDATSFEDATMGRISHIVRPNWQLRSAWALAAVIALLLTAAFFLQTRQQAPVSAPPVVATPKTEAPTSVAVVLGASPESGRSPGDPLAPGGVSQAVGWITLQTLKGVSVTFDAPFEIVLSDHDRMRLNQGRARVRVPPGAEGFRLESPSFDVVDLGTEFAAVVHPDGTGTCRVFEGKADVRFLDSVGEVKQTRLLSAAQSVRISPARQSIETVEERDDDYPAIKLPPRLKLLLAPGYGETVKSLGPAGYWRFEEIIAGHVANEGAGAAKMQSGGSATIVPEGGGNHSGELVRLQQSEYFQIPNAAPLLKGNFTISLFAQFEWLQNFALVSAMRYDTAVQGHPFILQSYSALRRNGRTGTALHAVFRDPPAWDGGIEILGNTALIPHRWYHIAAIRDRGTVTLHLDGQPVACESIGELPLDCRQIYLGRLNANPNQPRTEARGLVGRIDEFAIFPRALSEAEIRSLGGQENATN
jgi:Concanavalin A-like lectin/glucanases superfamily